MKEMLLNPQVMCSREYILAGQYIETSILQHEIPLLWKSFMPHRNITGRVEDFVYSVSELLPGSDWINFRPDTRHRKWACVEIEHRDLVPENMQLLILPASNYFVFDYSGTPQEFGNVWMYLLREYFPKEKLQIDNRFQFEIIDEKLKNGMPGFFEKIFIPIK